MDNFDANQKPLKRGTEVDDVAFVSTTDYEDNVEKKYVPEGFDSVEDFLQDMREEYQLDLEFDRDNRKAALDDKKFAAGEQWDPVVLEHRKGLPCLTINSVPQFTAQLVGDWRENKNGIKVVPAEDGDEEIASVRSDLIRAIQTETNATRVYNNAFESMVTCGDGAFRISVEYARSDVFDQDLCIRSIDDSLAVVWDRFSVDPTGKDARHVFVDDKISKKEFNKKWPGKAISTLGEEYFTDMIVRGWIDSDGVRVTEYWRLIERNRLLALFEDGSIRMIDGQNRIELQQRHGQIVKTRVSPVTYAQMHLVTGFAILSGPYEYVLNRVPIIRMTGRTVNIQGRRVRFGIVRMMKDPVRLRNFNRSVAAEQLGYAPKAQWIATQSAVEGREEALRKAHLSRDPLIIVNDEAVIGQNLQRLEPPTPQVALLQESQQNIQDMKDVTGIHDASLGIRSNETSGRAIQARQREGDIASLTYFDNANEALIEGGSVLNQLISQVYDGTRILRVIGEDESVKFLKVNDPYDPSSPDLSVGNYDVIANSGPTYSTRRVESAQAMMEAIQVFPQLMELAGDLVVKAQDWPGADRIAERLSRAIPPQLKGENEEGAAPAIDPRVVQQLQVQLQMVTQEYENLKNDKTIEMEKVKVQAFDAETKRLDVIISNQLDQTELGIKAISDAIKSDDPSPPSRSATSSGSSANRS